MVIALTIMDRHYPILSIGILTWCSTVPCQVLAPFSPRSFQPSPTWMTNDHHCKVNFVKWQWLLSLSKVQSLFTAIDQCSLPTSPTLAAALLNIQRFIDTKHNNSETSRSSSALMILAPLGDDPGSVFYSYSQHTWRIFSWHWSL